MKENPYEPWLATVEEIRDEVGGQRPIKTFKLKFKDKKIQDNFTYNPGQCAMVSLLGMENVSLQFPLLQQKKAT